MQIAAPTSTTRDTLGHLIRPTGHRFAKVMEQAQSQAGEPAQTESGLSPERDKALRQAAEQLVSISFIQPMLAKMRDDPFKSDLFHGGQAEEVFGQQLDTLMADRVTTSADFSIVDAVYRAIADSAARHAGPTPEVDTHA